METIKRILFKRFKNFFYSFTNKNEQKIIISKLWNTKKINPEILYSSEEIVNLFNFKFNCNDFDKKDVEALIKKTNIQHTKIENNIKKYDIQHLYIIFINLSKQLEVIIKLKNYDFVKKKNLK